MMTASLESMPWYHGKLSRETAERLLSPPPGGPLMGPPGGPSGGPSGGPQAPFTPDDGRYLVRDSEHFPGDYTLSIFTRRKIEHYRIENENSKLTIDREIAFDNLQHLVEHYERKEDGLCCRLVQPIKKNWGEVTITAAAREPTNHRLTSRPDSVTEPGEEPTSPRVPPSPLDFDQGSWKIPKDKLNMQELIGRGEFSGTVSNVFRADYNNRTVAVKIINQDRSSLQSFLSEARLMTSLRHENLVLLLGIVIDDNFLYIITEFMANGSLVDYLRTRGRAVINNDDQLRFAKDSCCGMAHLESQNIVHRDLAARNILIHENGSAKVSDFGLAVTTDGERVTGKLPIKWTAPEALKNNLFTSKSDVWSFGILLWEIYSFGRVPYPRIPLAEVNAYLETGARMEMPAGCPPDVYSIMRKTWNIDPDKRPSFKDMKTTLVSMCTHFSTSL